MSDSLTLHARGPITVEETDEFGEFTVTETVTRDVHAETSLDAEDLDDLGSVFREGCVLRPAAIGEHVAEVRSSDAVTYAVTPDQEEDWTLRLSGHVDDWAEVAVQAAQNRRVTGSNSKIATLACHILDSLAEYAEDRPLLAILDLLGNYEVDDFDRQDVLDRLSDDEITETTEPEAVEA